LFTYEQVFAADPSNPSNIAQNAAITIFAPGDVTMTPLTITDPDGQPLANPIPVNANGFGSAFAHATLDRVAWAGGGFTGFFTSYEGMKQVALDAQIAAESAVADADASAVAAEASATAATNAATDAINAGASNYAGLVQLAKNPDTLIAGAVTVDAGNLVTSAVVQWPDLTPGTLTITSRDSLGAVLAYNITYGSPVTKTFTQPTITRNTAGAATNVPQIVVS
jgi:hypothetical protein